MPCQAATALDHRPIERTETMQTRIPDQTSAPQEPICVACVGERFDWIAERPCQRCHGTGIDPDPAAPTGIAVAS